MPTWSRIMKEQFIPKTATGRRPGIKMRPEYITIHSTGNPRSTAQNEADNVCNNHPKLKVSFHAVVDDTQAIQVLPFNEVAWHAGDGTGKGNMASIGIEICESGNRQKALENAIRLVKDLMDGHKIPLKNVVQHNHWSGKDCPRILRNKAYVQGRYGWKWFYSKLEDENVEIKKLPVKINGKMVEVDAVNIKGNNYIKLRDLADADKNDAFEVGWDAASKTVIIESK